MAKRYLKFAILIICILLIWFIIFLNLKKENGVSEFNTTPQEKNTQLFNQVPQTVSTTTVTPTTQKTYINSAYKFSVSYPKTIGMFEDSFGVDATEHAYHCKWFDAAHDIHGEQTGIGKIIPYPPYRTDVDCAVVWPTFEEYVKMLYAGSVPTSGRSQKYFEIPNSDHIKMYGFYWEIPFHGSTPDSPQIGWSEVRHIIVDLPKGFLSESRALRFTLAGGSRSCPNAICEPGESDVTCPADCKDNWTNIINQIFSTLKFQQ